MNDRDEIFSRIRSALAPLEERTPLPEWEDGLAVCRAHPDFGTLKELFAFRHQGANGRMIDDVAALGAYLRDQNATTGFCDPGLAGQFRDHPSFSGIELRTEFDSANYDDYAFGITRASGAIAETGSLVLKDGETASRLAALSPWIHIAVLSEKDLVADVPEAIRRFGDDPAIVWCTGPSKTADVEGILIEGVHGPGVQACLFLD